MEYKAVRDERKKKPWVKQDKSLESIVEEKNKKYGLYVRELNKSTVQQYVAKGIVNMSPPRRGPTPKAPELLVNVLGLHASMMQASEG